MTNKKIKFPTLQELLESQLSEDDISEAVTDIIEEIGNSSFHHWYQAQKFAENIQNGQSYFNGVQSSGSPLRHSPSRLLQCHRKIYYRQQNAPKEKSNPVGIFWTGENFETELIVPYFRDVAGDEFYVQNSIWTDFTIKSRTGELHFKGETDPVFVDQDGIPFLLTEIKTKDSIKQLTSPDDRHLAQAHAYMYGLTEKYERRITDALLVYVDRSSLDLKAFHQEFDPVFWRNQAVSWAASQSEFRIENRLPPAEPQRHWECQFCAYRERCGKETDGVGESSPPIGFLPLMEYPEEMVTRHLEAYRDSGLLLTPTLAHQFPRLAEKFGTHDWRCLSCLNRYSWEALNPEHPGEFLCCPACGNNDGNQGTVRGPTPEEQLQDTDE